MPMLIMRAAGIATIWRPSRAPACCGLAWVRSVCRHSPIARRSTSTGCACHCIRRAMCWARRRCASSIAARSGWSAATTSCSPIRPARPSSRWSATPSSASRLSACRSTAGRHHRRFLPRSMPGGRPMPPRVARACCIAIRSERRSEFWPVSMRPSVRSSAMARSSRSTAFIARPASPCQTPPC